MKTNNTIIDKQNKLLFNDSFFQRTYLLNFVIGELFSSIKVKTNFRRGPLCNLGLI